MQKQSQDRASGSEAAEWAWATAPRIAERLDLMHVGAQPTISEYWDTNGRLLNLKVARRGNTKIGIYNSMRDRIDYVIAAFENSAGTFDLYKVDMEAWRKHAREASSGNPKRGKQTFWSRSDFRARGEHLGSVELTTASS